MIGIANNITHRLTNAPRRISWLFLLSIILYSTPLRAALSGTFTVGGMGANYPTLDSAIAALSAGISGPVTFRINSGTYVPPSGGYVLRAITGMSPVNTVTFKPARNAAVVIKGSLSTPIIDIDHGDYYLLDGSNEINGTTRDWQVINTGTGAALQFVNGATGNVVKNLVFIGNSNTTTTGIIKLGTSTIAGGIGNSENTIVGNTVGDSSGVMRSRVGIYARGSAGHNNVGNIIDGNDIINFGRGSGSAYGIAVSSSNQRIKILRNNVRMADRAGTGSLDIVYGIHYSMDDDEADTIAYNRIWNLNTEKSTTELNGIYLSAINSSPVAIFNNMIAIAADGGTLNGVYVDAEAKSIIFVEHNSIHIGGTSTRAAASNSLYLSLATATVRNNILSNIRTSPGDTTNLPMKRTGAVSLSSDHNLFRVNDPGSILGSFNGISYAGLDAWREGSGGDRNSVSGKVTFASVDAGDLHVDTREIFSGESIGIASGVGDDADGDARGTSPDAGADEGDFNGAGLAIIRPNGGDTCIVGYAMPILFSALRPMMVSVEISTDGGRTWIDRGTMNAVAGMNTIPVAMPEIETDGVLARVVGSRNRFEGDTSDAPFRIVRPVVTIISPDGRDPLVSGDTARIVWSSVGIPSDVTLRLDYSIDGGASWRPIAANPHSANLPATNGAPWIIPDAATSSALVRIGIAGATQTYLSPLFAILPRPRVIMTAPTPGSAAFAGDTITIHWRSTTTNFVRLQYSTDNGAGWLDVVPGGTAVPAYFGEYPWHVPDSAEGATLIRVIDDERPRYIDTTDAPLRLLRSLVRLTSPNGGEKFEPGRPVDVTWDATNAAMLRLEYSPDGGSTWETISDHIAAASGHYLFTPAALPTKRGIVRLSNVERARIADISDAPFQISSPRSIAILTPAAGERFAKGSTTVISWDAPRLDSVDILFSADGGARWDTLATDIASIDGAYVWTIPEVNTTHAKIRMRESGGSTYGETDLFAIDDAAGPSLSVIAPNGGESYAAGSTVPIRWTSGGLARLTIAWSSDDGTSWTDIRDGVPATLGQISWTAPDIPGTSYRIRISSGDPAISAMSRNPFSIVRRVTPAITIIAPNGGERLRGGTSTEIRWMASNITGRMATDYSTDGGATWTSGGTAISSGDGVYALPWTLPSTPTGSALVRVINPAAGDTSDATFEIVVDAQGTIALLSPNGGEIVHAGEKRPITWDAPPDVIAVDIDYSVDRGTSWLPVAANIPSTAAGMNYSWSVPTLAKRTTTARVRVRDHADTSRNDGSDGDFTIEAGASGIAGPSLADRGGRMPANYPNPFAETTEIRWEQERRSEVTVHLYDRNGRLVGRRTLGIRDAGTQRCAITSDGLASGAYLYELVIGATTVRGMMTVIR